MQILVYRQIGAIQNLIPVIIISSGELIINDLETLETKTEITKILNSYINVNTK